MVSIGIFQRVDKWVHAQDYSSITDGTGEEEGHGHEERPGFLSVAMAVNAHRDPQKINRARQCDNALQIRQRAWVHFVVSDLPPKKLELLDGRLVQRTI